MTFPSQTRTLVSLIAITGAALLGGCGGDSTPSPAPGSPEKPLAAQPREAPSSTGRSNESLASARRSTQQQGYDALVKRQSRKPRRRFTPCNLVTESQARAIVGAPIEQPLEAPQGPTCIYRSRKGESFVSLAVQSLNFDKLKPRIRQRQRFEISDRTAYCGQYGQPMLYVPIARGRVLSVAAPCSLAREFAAKALPRLSG